MGKSMEMVNKSLDELSFWMAHHHDISVMFIARRNLLEFHRISDLDDLDEPDQDSRTKAKKL